MTMDMNNEDWIELTPRQVGRPPEDGKVTVALHVPAVGTATLRMNISRVIGQAIGWVAKDKVKVAIDRTGKRLRLTKVPQEEGADPVDGYTVGVRGTTLTISVRVHWLMQKRETISAETAPHTIAGESLVLDLPAWARASVDDMACVAPHQAAPAPVPEPALAPADSPVITGIPVLPESYRKPKPVIVHEAAPAPVPAKVQPIQAAPVSRVLAEPPPPPRPPAGPIVPAGGTPEEDEREGKDMLAKGRSVREVAEWLGEDMDVVRRWKDQVEAAANARAAAEQGRAVA